jgi:hypothetical protein
MKLCNKINFCIEQSVNLLFSIQFQFFYLDSHHFFAFLFSIEFQVLLVLHSKIGYELRIGKELSFQFEFYIIIYIFSLFLFELSDCTNGIGSRAI